MMRSSDCQPWWSDRSGLPRKSPWSARVSYTTLRDMIQPCRRQVLKERAHRLDVLLQADAVDMFESAAPRQPGDREPAVRPSARPADVTRPRIHGHHELTALDETIRGQTQPPPENDPASGVHFGPQETTDFASPTTRPIPSNGGILPLVTVQAVFLALTLSLCV